MHYQHPRCAAGFLARGGDDTGLQLVVTSGILSASAMASPDFRAQLLAQEVWVQVVVMQESFGQSSPCLLNSKFDVRMRLDQQSDLRQELEAAADFESGRATVA